MDATVITIYTDKGQLILDIRLADGRGMSLDIGGPNATYDCDLALWRPGTTLLVSGQTDGFAA